MHVKIEGIPGNVTVSRVVRFAISCLLCEASGWLGHLGERRRALWLVVVSHRLLDEQDRERDDVGKRAVTLHYRIKAKDLIEGMERRS
jgi:hypothetical protein